MRLALCALLAFAAVSAGAPRDAAALDVIVLEAGKDRVDLDNHGDLYEGRGDKLLIETAPALDGVAGRMEVKAIAPGTNPNWVVFALRNTSDRPIERWLTADRYTLIDSGIVLPDLDSPRIATVTPSIGFVPERIPNDRSDVFRITVNPGETITYIAEISSEKFPKMALWEPLLLEKKLRDRALFNGIMIGISGLLAIFLTAIFAANPKPMFPTAAMIAWSVLAYLCVDFGFWHKIFQLDPTDNALYRAATESAVVASMAMFLYTFLRLGRWNSFFRVLMLIWLAGQLAIVAGSVLDPRLASTLARMTFLLLAGLGSTFILLLSLRGHDRALSLLPSWLLFLVWLFAAAMAAIGRLNGDIVNAGLVSGLVLIVLIIGFTVTQFAFRSFEPVYGGSQSDMQLRSLAIDAAGAAVWEWNSRRDEVKTGPRVEEVLGLKAGDLSTRVEEWTKHLHTADREKFRLALWSLQQKNGGVLQNDLRLRHADGTYRWFELRAETTPASDQRSLRLIGLMRDITATKRAHERLVQDAVIDNLTSLPNRELFLDRLSVAMINARQDAAKPELLRRPTVIVIDIDRFKDVNSEFGLIVGDSLLLTLARRLTRHLGPIDTLARTGGDQFAVMVLSEQDPRDIAGLAERVRRAIRSPMKIAGKDVSLTGSIGISVFDGGQETQQQLLAEAEAAMLRAKRAGSDRIELFKPNMRNAEDSAELSVAELTRALERKTIAVNYEPIMRLANEDVVGFEAVITFEHPRLGTLALPELMPTAEKGELVARLVSYLMDRALKDVARWHKELPRPDAPLFVTLNLSSRQLFRAELVQELRLMLGRETASKGSFRLAIDERLVVENPERSIEVLEWLKATGTTLVLDDFANGFSSLSDLVRFGFDVVRLNPLLVERAGIDDDSGALARSVVALVRQLGRTVAASGVDTPEAAMFLRTAGCDQAQGYYYGPPMTEREVLELLAVIRKEDRRNDRRGSMLPRMLSKVVDGARGRDGDAKSTAAKPAAAKSDLANSESSRGTPQRQAAATASGKVPSGKPTTAKPANGKAAPVRAPTGKPAKPANGADDPRVNPPKDPYVLPTAEVRSFPAGGRSAGGQRPVLRPEGGAVGRGLGRIAAAISPRAESPPLPPLDLAGPTPPAAPQVASAVAPIDLGGGALPADVVRHSRAVPAGDAAVPEVMPPTRAVDEHQGRGLNLETASLNRFDGASADLPGSGGLAAVSADAFGGEPQAAKDLQSARLMLGEQHTASAMGAGWTDDRGAGAGDPVTDELSRLSEHIRGMLSEDLASEVAREQVASGLATFRRRPPSAEASGVVEPQQQGGEAAADTGATHRVNGPNGQGDLGGEVAPGAVVKGLFARFSRNERGDQAASKERSLAEHFGDASAGNADGSDQRNRPAKSDPTEA